MQTTAAADITWTTDNLTREQIATYFGMGVAKDGEKWIAHILQLGKAKAVAHCESRATGAWDANERESHAIHRSLARLIEAGTVA